MFLNSGITAAYVGSTSVSKLYLGSTLVWPLSIDYKTKYLTMKFLSSGYVCLKKYNSTSPSLTVYYSKNGGEWISVLSDDATQINVVDGDEIRWKGTNSAYSTGSDNYCSFSGTSTFNLYGNILSLKYGDNFNVQNDTLDSYAFNKLFSTSRVADAYNLPLDFGTINERSLRQLFSLCQDLITAPKLLSVQTANILGAAAMFFKSYNLKNGMNISATTLNGKQNFQEIYSNCTALTNPGIIQVGNLTADSFSQAFIQCTSLETAPDLLADTLSNGSYYRLFYGCSKLNYVKCMATNHSATNCTYQWLSGVKNGGTFVKKRGVSWNSGNSAIPSSWTVIEED